MDLIDAGDYDFLLPRRLKKLIGIGLILGVAFVPPIQRWYVGQIVQHSKHFAQTLITELTLEPPTTRDVTPSRPTR